MGSYERGRRSKMSAFLSPLKLDYMTDSAGKLLKNRDGRQLFKLLYPFSYQSDILGCIVTVPMGFVTDLASIPRLPVIYLLLNGIADEAGVVHDYLYSTGLIPRIKADQVLREACICSGVSAWKASLIYAGVRIGGGSHYSVEYVV
jgi:hypothetical protein